MDIKTLLKVEPTTITIIPTHQCTASCENCCFACTPHINHRLQYDDIINYIDEILENFSAIELLVVSGGECFLLGEELERIIKYATSRNLLTRVVTNGYWATSYSTAKKRLVKLKESGLTEINFSTGDNHQQYVEFHKIVNAARAACDLDFRTVLISVESAPQAKFTASDLKKDHDLAPLIKTGKLRYMAASWMKFKKEKGNQEGEINHVISPKQPCTNIFQGIFINPYSQLLACCGITVENNKFLKLGSAEENSIKQLYDDQFNDLFKLWLYVDGPRAIYELVMGKRKSKIKSLPHECAYCVELIQDEKNVEIIRNIIKDELPGILYRQQFRAKKINIQT